jgi:multidrug resistance protein, MATE family
MITITSKQQFKQLFALAIPVSVGQASHIITTMTDAAMLGKYNALHMVAATLGSTVAIIPLILLIGVTIGITTEVAKLDGEGVRPRLLGSGLVAYTLFGLIIGVIIYGCAYLLPYLNPDKEVVTLAQQYIKLLAISALPMAVFLTLKQYFEGYSLTILISVASIVANLLNVLLNYMLIFGHFGFEPMGIAGAGYATLISRVCMIPLAFLFIYLSKTYKDKIQKADFNYTLSDTKQMLKQGLPIGFQLFIEVTAFCIAGILIGQISNNALGAHNVALQYAGLTFLVVTGFGSAATVLAGNYYGEKNKPMLLLLIKNVLLIVVGYEVFTALIFIIFSSQLPYAFLDAKEVEMITLSIVLIRFAAFFQIPDGLQNALNGLLRGVQDFKIPMYLSAFSHYAITLSSGCIFAFVFEMGTKGFWLGFLLGLSILALLLYFRLKKILNSRNNHFELSKEE